MFDDNTRVEYFSSPFHVNMRGNIVKQLSFEEVTNGLVSGTLIADNECRERTFASIRSKRLLGSYVNVSGREISVKHSEQLRYQELVTHGPVDASSVRAMINHDYSDESSGQWYFVEPEFHALAITKQCCGIEMTNPIPERRTHRR